MLDESAYRTLFARLSELVGTLVLDCGTGLDDPPARAALACADQLVLVCDDEPDTASIVAEAAAGSAGRPAAHARRQQPAARLADRPRRAGARHRLAHGLAVIPETRAAPGSCTTAGSPGARPRRLEHPDPGTRRTAHRRLAKTRDRRMTTPRHHLRSASTISILHPVHGARLPSSRQRASVRRTEIPSATNTPTVLAPCRELRCRR